jgi:hypothetical protein
MIASSPAPRPALGGKLVLAGLMAAVVVCGAAAPGPKLGAPKSQAASQPTPTRPSKPYVYPYDCARPISAQQDNLCLERRQAETAEKWGRLAFRADVAIAVGLVLIALAGAALAWALARNADATERRARALEKMLAGNAPGDTQRPPGRARSRPPTSS